MIYRKDDEEKREVFLPSVEEQGAGEVAYFALLAADMLELAEKYRRDVDDVHHIYFQVSCDRDKLIKILENGPTTKPGNTSEKDMPWQLIEDLAAKDDVNSKAYQFLVERRGEEEVRKRREFLQYQ